MSRSYHKSCSTRGVFYNWICYKSNKWDKTNANRKVRKRNRQRLRIALMEDNYDDLLLNIPREISDVWDFNSDGLKFFIPVNKINDNEYILNNWIYVMNGAGTIYTKSELKKQFIRK